MATLPIRTLEHIEPKLTYEQAASELYQIVEGHFDDLELSEEERDARYAKAAAFLDAKDASNAKA